MTERPADRANAIARSISARYYDHTQRFGREDMDAAIAAALRAHADRALRERRLYAMHGDSPVLVAAALTGRREFASVIEANTIIQEYLDRGSDVGG